MAERLTALPRQSEEVVERIRQANERGMFGFEAGEYLCALTFEEAKSAGLLKPDATDEGWEGRCSVEDVSERAKSYMDFWLEKIEDERGISVVRATAHFVAWKWLLGHPDSDRFPGAPAGPDGGWYQWGAYNYIRAQIDSGEWDRLTATATGGES